LISFEVAFVTKTLILLVLKLIPSGASPFGVVYRLSRLAYAIGAGASLRCSSKSRSTSSSTIRLCSGVKQAHFSLNRPAMENAASKFVRAHHVPQLLEVAAEQPTETDVILFGKIQMLVSRTARGLG
jgi:hypothetical protein